MNEILNQEKDMNNLETVEEKVEGDQESTAVDANKVAEEMLVNEEDLKIDGEKSREEYKKTLAEALEMKNPEEELAILEADFKGRDQDYRDMTHKGSGSSGAGGIDFNRDNFEKIQNVANKYPGIDKIADLLKIAEEENTPEKVGGFMGIGATKKDPKLSDRNFGAVKTALINGGGEFSEEAAKRLFYSKAIEFLAEHDSDLLKTEIYQLRMLDICKVNKEFAEKYKGLLIAPNEYSNRPTSISEATGRAKSKEKLLEFKVKHQEASNKKMPGSLAA